MINYNFHQHSNFSDGTSPLEDYVQKALDLGFIAIGFSEHSPLPFETKFSLKQEKISDYIKETDALKNKYKNQIKLYRSLEMDYIPVFSNNFRKWKNKVQADYLIGSVHLVKPDNSDSLWFIDGPNKEIYDIGLREFFNGDIKNAVKTYYYQVNDMVETQQFDIVGHIDKIKMHNKNRFFHETERWYKELAMETLFLIKEKDLIVELNTRGLYKKRSNSFFPDDFILYQLKEMNIPIIISSDAHKPEELNLFFDEATKRLKDIGIKYVVFFNGKNWLEKGLD